MATGARWDAARGQMSAYHFLDGVESQGVPVTERERPQAIEDQVVRRANTDTDP